MPVEPRKGRSLIRAALDIAADQWTLLVLRELYMGARQWSDFTAWLNIPPATLNQRLKQLVETGCVAKHSVAGSTSIYQLTEKGVDRFAFQMAAREWQLRWHPRGGAFVTPWVHDADSAALQNSVPCLRQGASLARSSLLNVPCCCVKPAHSRSRADCRV